MFEIPTSVTIQDNQWKVTRNGDFRMILDCFNALNDNELDDKEKAISALIIFYEDLNSVEEVLELSPELSKELIDKMEWFFNCGQMSVGLKTNYKLVDWELDSHTIAAAVNNVAKTEVRAMEYLHWWTFMGYYLSIGESVFSTIVDIRLKTAKNKKLEKHEQEFKRNNPQYFMFDCRVVGGQSETQQLLSSIWNQE